MEVPKYFYDDHILQYGIYKIKDSTTPKKLIKRLNYALLYGWIFSTNDGDLEGCMLKLIPPKHFDWNNWEEKKWAIPDWVKTDFNGTIIPISDWVYDDHILQYGT